MAAKKKPKIGTCKTVRKKNGCTIDLCYTGKGKTGWQFKKGTSKCPTRGRRRSR